MGYRMLPDSSKILNCEPYWAKGGVILVFYPYREGETVIGLKFFPDPGKQDWPNKSICAVGIFLIMKPYLPIMFLS